MAKSAGEKRVEVIRRISTAITAGKSATTFLAEMRSKGLGYRKTTFLSDWRTEGNIKKKKGLLKYVRKNYRPSAATYAETEYNYSREYIYLLKVRGRMYPGEPVTDTMVSIQSDRPLTPIEMEGQLEARWDEWDTDRPDELVAVIPETAMRKVVR